MRISRARIYTEASVAFLASSSIAFAELESSPGVNHRPLFPETASDAVPMHFSWPRSALQLRARRSRRREGIEERQENQIPCIRGQR